MRQYIIRRLILILPVVLGASLIVFFLVRVAPGDIVLLILEGQGQAGKGGQLASTEADKLREELGLNKPIHVQYLDWLGGIVRLDMGKSMWTGRDIAGEIKERYPVTLQLALMAIFLSILVALPVGILSAIYQDTWVDYVFRIFTVTTLAIPNFFVAILLILALVLWFGYTPPLGFALFWEDPTKNLQQMIFPAAVLGLRLSAIVGRLTRSQMLEVMRLDYIRTARAKGLMERTVVYRHALKNALLPVITVSAIQFGALLGGTVIMETIFSLPGLGRALVEAIRFRDYTVVQNLVLLAAFTFASINLIVDVVYAWLDPRVSYG